MLNSVGERDATLVETPVFKLDVVLGCVIFYMLCRLLRPLM